MNIIKQKGSATVEFAMMVPILLILVFMVSELGTMFYRLNALTKSVQVASRYLSDVSLNKKITLTKTTIKHLVCYGNTGNTGTEVLPDCINKIPDNKLTVSAASDHVTVSATYSADWILPNAVKGFLKLSGLPMDLTASSVMRFTQ
ncbi:hypothetical protein BCS42_05440 [Crenothrix sp. D3]|nr:hypothetical protein BCS42_05440 [Crenothrix sp. D3]